MKIAILSDIHSAAAPYRAALAAARAEGFDRLVILGDLLTYGPEPEQSLELTEQAIASDGAVLILGNHDSLYLPGDGYSRPLPDWIEESVEWTKGRIAPGAMEALPWRTEWQEDGLLLSHANPFGSGDWSYLRGPDDYQRAASCLAERGLSAGVFGHVHRFAEHRGPAAVYTVGSIGQPRNREDKRPHWAMGELGPAGFTLSARPLDYEWEEHCRALRSTNMSAPTIDQLCRFYL